MKNSPISIPDPSAHGISPKYGFLSADAPLTRFPKAYYEPWDSIANELPALIKSGSLQKAVANLPLLEIEKLETEFEYRRAYVVLAFIIHAHVWAPSFSSRPTEDVPPQLAEPFLQICEYLGMEPVVSYAGLVMWNWQLLNGGGMDLENMEVLTSFTGTRGEAAFYHVPVLTEYEGGALVHLLLDAIAACSARRDGWVRIVVDALEAASECFVRMGGQMGKLYSLLEPEFFYHEHRPFMAGGKGMEEKGLQRGMVFHRVNGEVLEKKLVGGSAVQSSLFPFLDYVFGIRHVDGAIFTVRGLLYVAQCRQR